jgi:hypothetical protein
MDSGGCAMVWVVKADYLGGYRLRLTFNDGTEGQADLKEIMFSDTRELFKELQDVSKFGAFRVEMDTVVWENGLDLAPEFLYDLAVKRNLAKSATGS